ncbi:MULTISPECIES: helix-turn-helix domain-containing protein [Actinomycetes]|uniref:helix-turn-helix domain-containing protein n=1 Tax=Actinomycetes TaxID=1760 RepID=UPI0004BFFAA1|nr:MULTISPECIES: helix-turn-helix domain-containing protein [Actinomycetes]
MPAATKRLTTAEQRDLDQAIESAIDKYGEYMTAPQFQKFANISATTANRWRRERPDTPHATPVGRRWRYDTRQVVAYFRGVTLQ